MKRVYMHLLNGRPARFNGDEVIFCDETEGEIIEPSLKVIYRNTRQSKAFDKKHQRTEFKYSFISFLITN